jgi:hypothetical protein
MASLKTRISGKVQHTEKQQFGAGERAFKFLEIFIQTSPASIVPVRITDRWEYETPRVGDVLDLEVEISGFSGRNGVDISLTATKPFDEAYYREVAGVAA